MVKINKKIEAARLPKHIAFIMDGNGRWASARGLARKFGHEAGYKSMIAAIKRCAELGINVVSFYAFSTENWGRPKDEVDHVFNIAREKISADFEELSKYGVKVITMGDVTRFPKDLQEKLHEVIEKTKNNDKCILNFCINYGGRDDIVKAVNKIVSSNKGSSQKKEITEDDFKKYLYSAELPDPDLIVRTSGEQRISNFMLYQMAYSEFYFPKLYWPNVNEKFIDKCVIEYQKRKRRFGKL